MKPKYYVQFCLVSWGREAASRSVIGMEGVMLIWTTGKIGHFKGGGMFLNLANSFNRGCNWIPCKIGSI